MAFGHASSVLTEARKQVRMAQADWEEAKKGWEEVQAISWMEWCLKYFGYGVYRMVALATGVASGLRTATRWLGKGML